MRHPFLVLVAIVCIGVAILAELFYFRFHTYFQRIEIQEMLPSSSASFPEEDQEIRIIVQGLFVAVDAIHKGSGNARIVEQGEKRYLRLEDFNVTNGPDLYVYLSESTAPQGTLQSLDRYVNLGLLKGNAGNQTYEIPEAFQGYNTVVIWCQQFGVLFSYAVMY